IVKVNLYVDEIPVGSKHIPYLPSGHSRTITMYYNPLDHADVKPTLKNLSVRAFSELAGFSRDEDDPLSHSIGKEFVDEGAYGSGDGVGCDAGTGGLLIFGAFGALGTALLTLKKRG
ncbi:MAG: hypothetical protein LBO21_06005, partial [Synergistaceae bacterium]|nr:hypothetical protein [Synergistaceae bacterium]